MQTINCIPLIPPSPHVECTKVFIAPPILEPLTKLTAFNSRYKYLTVDGDGDISVHQDVPYNLTPYPFNNVWFSFDEMYLEDDKDYPTLWRENDLIDLIKGGTTEWHEAYFNLKDQSIIWVSEYE